MRNLNLLLLLSLTFSTVFGFQTKEITTLDGSLKIRVDEHHIAAQLNFNYIPKEDTITGISLYLTRDVTIHNLQGETIKNYNFDTTNEKMPFGILKIEFSKPLEAGEATAFELSYSGTSTKGFFTEDYNWVDIDPDFMILPAFTDLHSFTYSINATLDNPSYKFVDAENEQMSSSLIARTTNANYFASIVAGSDMQFNKFTENGFTVNIISNKERSIVDRLGAKSLEILKFFNNKIGKEKEVNGFSVLYRPMADIVFPTMRNLNHVRLIMFTSDHRRIPTLAHEVSHFWWNRGNDFTMEKWLNESFAEYSENMYLRETEGQEGFEKGIEAFRKVSSALSPLLDYDRFGDNWSDMLYFKGPYLLYQLEEKIGTEKFLQFLNELNAQEVATTVHLLEVLENVAGRENKAWFTKRLTS